MTRPIASHASAPAPSLPLGRIGTCLAIGLMGALTAAGIDSVIAPTAGEPVVLRWVRTAAGQRGRLLLGTALILLAAFPGPPGPEESDSAMNTGSEGL
jgi:hypothetical protein